MLRRVFLSLAMLVSLAACGAEPIWSEQHEIDRVAFRAPGPAKLTLITVINNRSGSGAHTGLLINGSQRVMWDPAGTWWNPNAPERNDLHYGLTDRMVGVYIDYHTRETFHTVVQEITVSPEVAQKALMLAANYGAVPKAQCSLSTSKILSQLPGFESIPVGYFPTKTMDAFSKLPGVTTRKVYDDDPDDNSAKLPANGL
ncbi:hypothetical protein [uncultured Litoreibacter sp.]|uniref:hypothetical protein n=1 Tax=uncultured Litoreibacter sp. TaxID=1392394 RepID=UPI0026376C32|nr:hypothetical protein [uncultured Litoreibacter sp.]